MKKFSEIVIKYRAIIIAVCIVITLVMAFFLKDIKINADLTTYLPKSDSVVARFDYIGKTYASSQLAIIIVEAEKDIFTRQTLEHISQLTKGIQNIEGVTYVTSITNVIDIRLPEVKTDTFSLLQQNFPQVSIPDISKLPPEELLKLKEQYASKLNPSDIQKFQQNTSIPRLIDENNLPKTDEDLKRLKEYTLSKKLYKDRLVSSDSKYSVIVCRLAEGPQRNDVAKKVRDYVISQNLPEKFYFEGMPFQVLYIMDFIWKDLMFLTPLIVLVITVVLLISFRNLRGILAPVLAVGMGIIWSLGLMSLTGVKLSPISDAIPVVLFAIGSAYGIHIVNRFRLMVSNPNKKLEQAKSALTEVGFSVLLAGVTTVMGFLSFIFGAYLNVISEFGIFTALGVIFILILSLTFTPAFLSYFNVQKHARNPLSSPKYDIIGQFLRKLSAVILKRPVIFLIIALVLIITSIAGIPLLENKIDILNYFKPNSEIRKSAAVMNKEFGGSLPIMVRVRGDILQPQTIEKMRKVEQYMNNEPDINNVSSIVGIFDEIGKLLYSQDTTPMTREKYFTIWKLIENEDMVKQMMNRNLQEAVIQASVKNVDTERYREIYNNLNQFLHTLNTGNLLFEQTGMPGVYSNFDSSMMKNLIQSLILALILVFICMIFLLRSVKGAIIGMIPLMVTMLIVFGFMGYVRIALDIATILIASITVGAGIDYAIHFITEYKRQIISGKPIHEAIDNTIRITGKPILINVITIVMGFLVLVFASMLPLINFGILVAITMLFSGFGAITILPAIIKLFNLQLVKKS